MKYLKKLSLNEDRDRFHHKDKEFAVTHSLNDKLYSIYLEKRKDLFIRSFDLKMNY
jgi:hypothetical protein